MSKAKPPRRPTNTARPKPSSRTPRPAAGTYRSWSLLVIAQEPVRQAATNAYRRANARFVELRAIIERFSTVDRPAFGGWLAATFGPLLTALRETEEQINAKGPMLDTIRIMTLVSGCRRPSFAS